MTFEELQDIGMGMVPSIADEMKKHPPRLRWMLVLWDPTEKVSCMAGNMTPDQMVNYAQNMMDFEQKGAVELPDKS